MDMQVSESVTHPHADPSALLAFEWGGIVIYCVGLMFCVRLKSPFYLGIFIACNLMIFWDWIFNMKWYFNVTFHPDLTRMWILGGEHETLAAALAFVGMYSWLLMLMTKYSNWIDRKFGLWQYPLMYVLFFAQVMLLEVPSVNAGIWHYWQRPEYLWHGVALSNGFMNAHLVILCFVMLKLLKKWTMVSGNEPFTVNLGREAFWKPVLVAIAGIQAGMFFTFVIQMFWYLHAEPWIPSPRLF
jgi:hypothetical protein